MEIHGLNKILKSSHSLHQWNSVAWFIETLLQTSLITLRLLTFPIWTQFSLFYLHLTGNTMYTQSAIFFSTGTTLQKRVFCLNILGLIIQKSSSKDFLDILKFSVHSWSTAKTIKTLSHHKYPFSCLTQCFAFLFFSFFN